ncbi:hypothetical protein HMPREF1591_01861, partial [Escherichia coli 113303]
NMHPDGQHVAPQVQSLLVLYRSTLFRWLIVVNVTRHAKKND